MFGQAGSHTMALDEYITDVRLQHALQVLLKLGDAPRNGMAATLVEAIAQADTYEEAGVSTSDAGLVVRFQGGAEFQITIKRTAWSYDTRNEQEVEEAEHDGVDVTRCNGRCGRVFREDGSELNHRGLCADCDPAGHSDDEQEEQGEGEE